MTTSTCHIKAIHLGSISPPFQGGAIERIGMQWSNLRSKKNKSGWTFFLFFAFMPVGSMAQIVIEERVLNKFSISPYLGVSVFQPDYNYDEQGISKNLYGGYSPGPLAGISGWYGVTKKLSVGSDINFTFSKRKGNSIDIFGISALAKLSSFTTKFWLSPYVVAGFNLNLIIVDQPKATLPFFPEDTLAIGDGLKATKIEYNNNQLTLYMAPLLGPIAGVGFDLNINTHFTGFAQLTLQTSMGRNNFVQSAFSENNGLLQYATLRTGVIIRLTTKMKFKIDSQAVKVPDAIVYLTLDETNRAHGQLFSREGNFDVNLREGLRHSIKMSIKNSEINLVIDQKGDPCRIMAKLMDKLGNKVAEKEADPSGHVNFGGLENGDYNIVLEPQPPCKETSFSYTINQGLADIRSQGYEEYTPEGDTSGYFIEGNVAYIDPKKSRQGIDILLVDDVSKMVLKHQSTNANGGFEFSNLKSGKYKVIYEAPSKRAQSRLKYVIKDKYKHIKDEKEYEFNEKNPKHLEASRLSRGKLEFNDPNIAAYKVDLDLVDKYGRIVQHSIPDDDGTYEFLARPSDRNDIYYELNDKKLQKTIDPSNIKPLIKDFHYSAKGIVADSADNENKTGTATKTKSPFALAYEAADVMATHKVTVPGIAKLKEEEMEMYKIYNHEGAESNIEGFGFQVGSFRSLGHVKEIIHRLRSEGFEPYVQTIMSTDLQTRFKSKNVYKLNRIIVFAGNDEAKAAEIRTKLEAEGHFIIVKEHFKPNGK